MIRIMVFTFLATLIVLNWPIVAICAGAFMLWRRYPRGA